MLKRMKTKLILTTIITILPLFIGLLLWNQLPDPMVTHWNFHGTPDGWSSKLFTVVGLPLFLTAIHWICVFATSADPKSQNHSDKILTLVLWTCPVVSIFCMASVYAEGLGYHVSMEKYAVVLVGLLFVAIGNYLPKCKQNYTIGIKVPWTLNSTENWNRTHRIAGKVWTTAGLIFMLLSWFNFIYLATVMMLIMAIFPMIYSYWYYRKYECK